MSYSSIDDFSPQIFISVAAQLDVAGHRRDGGPSYAPGGVADQVKAPRSRLQHAARVMSGVGSTGAFIEVPSGWIEPRPDREDFARVQIFTPRIIKRPRS